MDKYTNSLQKLSPQAHLILRGRMFSSILHRAAEDGRRAGTWSSSRDMKILEVRCFCDCSMLECRSCVSARERYGGGGGEPSNIDPALQVDSENSGGLAMRV